MAAKKLHYNNVIHTSKNITKITWKVINTETGKSKQSTEIQSLMIDNNEIRNQKEIAITMNNYFLSVADSIITDISKRVDTAGSIKYLSDNFKKPFTTMNWHYATTYETEKVIKSLKSKNSCGYDGISNKIIQLSTPFIISPLTYICNAVLNKEIFPDRLICAIIKPIFKKVIDKISLITDSYHY